MFVEKPGEDFTALKLISGYMQALFTNMVKLVLIRVRKNNLMVNYLWFLITLLLKMKIGADTDSQEFINHIGDILVVLLDEEIKELNGKN